MRTVSGMTTAALLLLPAVFNENGRKLSLSQVQIPTWTIQLPADRTGSPCCLESVTARSYVISYRKEHMICAQNIKVFLSAAMAEVLDF